MIFEIGKYKLDIDVEKTREFYKTKKTYTYFCDCAGCRNFYAAIETFPQEVKDFFDRLGVDPKKGAEHYVVKAEDDGKTAMYGGWYHLCGRIMNGENCWKPVGEGQLIFDDDMMYSVADGWLVGFSDQTVYLLPDGFPTPVLQMEIAFLRVPWVLDIENPYTLENMKKESEAMLKAKEQE